MAGSGHPEDLRQPHRARRQVHVVVGRHPQGCHHPGERDRQAGADPVGAERGVVTLDVGGPVRLDRDAEIHFLRLFSAVGEENDDVHAEVRQ